MAETPSTYFPDVLLQVGPRKVKQHRTEILEMRSGREVRRAVYDPLGYERWSASSDLLEQEDAQLVAEFVDARRGAFEAFWFFRWKPSSHTDMLAGSVSAASSLVSNFKGPWFKGRPPVAAAVTTVKVGATLGAAVSVAFSLTPNIGAGGQDRINFTSVSSTTITAGGTGYTSAPTVVFSAPPAGGTLATGTATISGGAVTGITITNPGSGYVTAPTISFTGGGGTGATATSSLARTGSVWVSGKSIRVLKIGRWDGDDLSSSFGDGADVIESFTIAIKEVR